MAVPLFSDGPSVSRLRSERLWLLLAVIWVIAITLAPLELSYSPNELPARLEETFRITDALSPLKVAAHLSSLFIVGALVAGVSNREHRFVKLWIVGSVGCLLLEATQMLQLGRHARVTDFILNVIGLGLGVWFAKRTPTGQNMVRRLRASESSILPQAVVAVGALAAWWIIGLLPAMGGLRMNWDRTFPLIIGNEIGGTRFWGGTIRYVGIYDRALPPTDVRNLHNGLGKSPGSDFRLNDGLLAGYDFQQRPTGELQPQGELKDMNLELIVPPNLKWSAADGLTMSPTGLVRSRGAATSLTDRIISSGSFSVETWGQPANLLQVGPARLVSVSSGPAARNFTLGQAASDLVFRVRNTVNSANGTNYELVAYDTIAPRLQHFVATYDHGVSTIYQDGNARSTVDLREPVFYSGLATGTLARVALLVLAVVTIALPATFVFRRWCEPKVVGFATLAFAFVAGILPFVISCCAVGGPLRIGFIGWFLAALLLVYPPCAAFISKKPVVVG